MGSFAGRVVATIVVALDGTGDTTDIQEGINLLPAGGGVVYVKEGTYTITSSIVINQDNVALFGSGFGTVIYVANGMNDAAIKVSLDPGDADFCIIADLKIDGNKLNQVNINSHGISTTQRASRVTVKNCYIYNCKGNGIYIEESGQSIITNCYIIVNDGDGIKVSGSTDECILSNNILQNNEGININCAGALTIISSNQLFGGTSGGILIASGDRSIINSNVITNAGTEGIKIAVTSSGNCVEGNFVWNSNDDGILIDGDNNIITGNRLKTNAPNLTDNGADNEIAHNQTAL